MAEVLIARFRVLTVLLLSALKIFRNVGNRHLMALRHIPDKMNLKYLSPSSLILICRLEGGAQFLASEQLQTVLSAGVDRLDVGR
jgi:hypothetical protein